MQFCDGLFYGVVIVDFEDGGWFLQEESNGEIFYTGGVLTARLLRRKKERCLGIAEGGAYFVTRSVEGTGRQELHWQEKRQLCHRLLLSRTSEREIRRWEEMAHSCSSDSGSYYARSDAMGREEQVGRDGLSFDSDGSEDQMAGKDTTRAGGRCWEGETVSGGGGGTIDTARQLEAAAMVEKG
ncbi:hypothetical protein BHE74_00027417 [Ensete ventricosum]|nr:hypothetical protein BHE74_00027417 [Ensete ventricosum]